MYQRALYLAPVKTIGLTSNWMKAHWLPALRVSLTILTFKIFPAGSKVVLNLASKSALVMNSGKLRGSVVSLLSEIH